MAVKKYNDKIDVDGLVKMFDPPSWDDIDELNLDYYGSFSVGIEDEDEAMEAEQEGRDEVYRQWRDAVLYAAEQLFDKHDLELTTKNDRDYKIVPSTSWRDAARSIMTTINGVGEFEFDSLKEFLESGPYTPRQAVLSHLHWIAYYPEVYDSSSARRMYEWAF